MGRAAPLSRRPRPVRPGVVVEPEVVERRRRRAGVARRPAERSLRLLQGGELAGGDVARSGPACGGRPVGGPVRGVGTAVLVADHAVAPAGRSARRSDGAALEPRRAEAPVRRTVRPVSPGRYRLRRAVAAAVVALAAAGLVVGLGTLAGVAGAAQARSTVPAGTVAITVRPGDTVWDIARRDVPTGDPAAVVERIVQVNGLPNADVTVLPAGRTLQVPA
ncbi:LysM peptidoglycan-binding domain-containing protein [Pseudonocardia ailaonensis]